VRISVLSAARDPSPRARALLYSLANAGHDVALAGLDSRRFLGETMRDRIAWSGAGPTSIAGGGRRSRPQIIHPDTSRMTDAADRMAARLEAWVARRPDWPRPERDLIAAAPARPELSVPASGPVPEREPWLEHTGEITAGRHRGRRVALCFRSTPASPAHRLRAALERAGVEVVVGERIDFTRLEGVDLIVIVESPTPPIEMVGNNPGIPVVFWVHHGEHHLDGNLRLAAAYGADLVLLAHSWHLAYRFDRRVERFPFGAESSPSPPPFSERRWDLGFVGAIEGSAYARRRSLLEQARSALEQVEARSGIPPQDIPDLYRHSRAVLDEGGIRHFPITMRVFEATGAGALLVTDPAPGLELILGHDYHGIPESGLDGDALRTALADGSAEARATNAYRRVQEMHTYDHRVDLLLRLTRELTHEHDRVEPDPTPLGGFLASHPYGQRILDLTGAVDAPDREVYRPGDISGDLSAGSFDTVVVSGSPSPDIVRAARRYLIGFHLDPDTLPGQFRSVTRYDDLVVIDLGSAGYDIETVGGPPPPSV
jgi:hypothetical protein